MYNITMQTKRHEPMRQMNWQTWQESLKKAKPIVELVRQELALYDQTGDKAHKTKADAKKRTLPGACFQASNFELSTGTKKYNMDKLGRWREQVHAYLNGLGVIDVDHIADPHALFQEMKGTFDFHELGILLIYVSASGKGMKIVFVARPEWGNLICNQYEMASLLGVLESVDDACKDSSRLSFLTGPDDVLYIDSEALFNIKNA